MLKCNKNLLRSISWLVAIFDLIFLDQNIKFYRFQNYSKVIEF